MSASPWPVIGHQKIVRYLQAVIERQNPNHAYLFYGAAGLGKNLVADLFAQGLLCQGRAPQPCGACVHCLQFIRQIHPDVINLTRDADQKNISVEAVRQVRSEIQNSSLLDSYKIVLVREAETLSLGAINALLKILEEPVGRTIFIFISEDLKSLPRTLLSRLQVIKFLPVGHEDLENYFLAQGLERSLAYDLAHLSLGFPGRVLSLAAHSKIFNDYKSQTLNLVEQLSGSLIARLSLAEQLAGQNNSVLAKDNARQFLISLLLLVRDALLLKNNCAPQLAERWLESELTVFNRRYSTADLLGLLAAIRATSRSLSQNINVRLALENLLLAF